MQNKGSLEFFFFLISKHHVLYFGLPFPLFCLTATFFICVATQRASVQVQLCDKLCESWSIGYNGSHSLWERMTVGFLCAPCEQTGHTHACTKGARKVGRLFCALIKHLFLHGE